MRAGTPGCWDLCKAQTAGWAGVLCGVCSRELGRTVPLGERQGLSALAPPGDVGVGWRLSQTMGAVSSGGRAEPVPSALQRLAELLTIVVALSKYLMN